MRKTLFILACISLSCLSVYSQRTLRSISINRPPDKAARTETTETADEISGADDDTVYCFSTKKQHGWFYPHGLLTKEQVRHRYQSFMFTGKNERGHWTKLESINASGKHVNSNMSPYIAKIGSELDSLINTKWSEKLAESCIFEFIPDPTGESIVQERAYDSNHKLLYAFSRIPIGDNQYIGSYKDVYGLPAEMRMEDGFSYGTLVIITEDQWGNDHRIEYIDSKGNHKQNADNAYAEIYDCDKDGSLLQQYSVNETGDKIRDAWGNCGLLHTYDKNLLTVSNMYTDENDQPMTMRAVHAAHNCGTTKAVYSYDKYFRLKEIKYVTPDGKPDRNIYGSHRIVYEYDSLGNQTDYRGYDIDETPSQIDRSGTSRILSVYDDKSNLTTLIFLDKSGHPVPGPDYLSKIEYGYSPQGERTSLTQYICIDGAETVCYSEKTISHPEYNETKIQWMDGSYETTRNDLKGRKIYYGRFNADGKPIMNDENWAYYTTAYKDSGKKTEYITEYFDDQGKPAISSNYERQMSLVDSLTRTETVKRYKSGSLISIHTIQYDEQYIYPLNQQDNNVYGHICRAGGESGARHYKADVQYTPFSEIASLVGKDEFDEPDYIVNDDGSLYYYARYTKSGRTVMTPENESGYSDSELKDALSKIMTVEVIDSTAYALGLKDNDVILQYGDYSVDLKQPLSLNAFKFNWAVRAVIDANKTKDMVVFRVYDGKTDKYGIDTIRGLSGTPSALGFIPHIRYLTKRQTDRILSCIDSSGLVLKKPADENEKKHYAVIDYPELYRSSRQTRYATEITDPSIFLGGYDVNRNLKWDSRNGNSTDDLEKMLQDYNNGNSNYRPTRNYYFTKDGSSIINITTSERQIGMNLYDGWISEADYQALQALTKTSERTADRIFAETDRLDPRKLKGYWIAEPNDTAAYSVAGYLYFNADGTCLGRLTGHAFVDEESIPENYGSPIFMIERTLDGQWKNGIDLISFYSDKKSNPTVTCVDIYSPKTDKNKAVEYFTSDYPEYRSYYDKRMVSLGDFNNEAFVKEIGKNYLILDDGCGNETRFIKAKGKPTSVKNTTRQYNDRQIIGNWIGEMDDGVSIILTFDNKGKVSMLSVASLGRDITEKDLGVVARISIEGKWKVDKNNMSITFDRNNIDLSMEPINLGISEDDLNAIISEFETNQEKLKADYANAISDIDAPIETLTDSVLVFEDMKLRKAGRHDMILGSVVDETGFLAESGYSGSFIVLKWCDWDCKNGDINSFETEFEKQRSNPKNIILLPIETDGSSITSIGSPVMLDCPARLLGLRIKDTNIADEYFIYNILSRYLIFR